MTQPPTRSPSARQIHLLEATYHYVLEHGLCGLSLRPLATAIGTSPRVLLFLFNDKDGLVRAVLERARSDELMAIETVRHAGHGGLRAAGEALWTWLAAPERRALLTLWLEAYARSLVEPDGPSAEFAAQTTDDWLRVLDAAARSEHPAECAAPTLLLSVVRGMLLDLLATGDLDRTDAAVRHHLETLPGIRR